MKLLRSGSVGDDLVHAEAVDDGLVVATAPRSIGPITVSFIGDEELLDPVVITDVVGGSESLKKGVIADQLPAIAVDRANLRVAVVGESTASVVDLTDMSVDDVDLDKVSWIEGLMAWFVPSAYAKESVKSSVRFGYWLGDKLAVTGSNSTLNPQDRITAAGLRFIDVDSGRRVLVEERVSGIEVASGRVLAFDHTGQKDFRKEQDDEGIGVVAFDQHGRELWHALDRRYVSGLQVVGCLAYAEAGWDGRHTAILDIRSGRVIDEVPEYPPSLLGEIGDATEAIGEG